MRISRGFKILLAASMGAVAGSFMGIAAFGDAVAATIPLSILFAYICYNWTKADPVADVKPSVIADDPASELSAWQQIEGAANDAIPIIERAGKDSVSVLRRFFAGAWNLLMEFLILINVMPFFVKIPWLHFILIFALMALFFPVGVFFLISALVALNSGAKADDKFMIQNN